MDRSLSDSTIADFLDGVERKAKGEGRKEKAVEVVCVSEIGELPADGPPIVSIISEDMLDALT